MTDKGTKPASSHRGRLLLVIGVLVAVGLAADGIWSRKEAVADLQRTADDAALPRVQVISPKPGPSHRTLTLPGEIEAWYAGADLRPGLRLCRALVQGLWRAGEGGRSSGDDRHPRPGRPVRGFQGGPCRRASPLQAGRSYRQPLDSALWDTGGLTAGCRCEAGGCRGAEGAGGRRRAKCRPLPGPDGIQAGGCAVRRRGDRAAHQYWRLCRHRAVAMRRCTIPPRHCSPSQTFARCGSS